MRLRVGDGRHTCDALAPYSVGVVKAIPLRGNLMQRSLIPGWIWHFPHGIAVRVRGIVAANQVVSTIGGI